MRMDEAISRDGSRHVNVFIADDSPIIHDAVQELLRDETAFTVAGQAYDVPSAIAGTHSPSLDVVILDYQMPGGTGLDVLHAIKSRPSSPKVILWSFGMNESLRKRCLKEGADFAVSKNGDPDTLLTALHHVKKETCA